MNTRKRFVIYTAIFGSSDTLKNPLYAIEDADLVCFTDQPLVSKFFDVRLVVPTATDPKRSAEEYKLCPHRFLSEYEYSLWIDASVLLKITRLEPLIEQFLREHSIAFFAHPDRDCIYDELQACLELHKDDPEVMRRQIARYRQEKYPAHHGLISGGFIMRRHNDPAIVSLGEAWLAEVNAGSKRDQLSFNYVAWKNNIAYTTIPGWSWDNEYITVFARHSERQALDLLKTVRETNEAYRMVQAENKRLHTENVRLQQEASTKAEQLQTRTETGEQQLRSLRQMYEKKLKALTTVQQTLQTTCAELNRTVMQLRATTGQQAGTIQVLYRSWSWRITWPLRKLVDLVLFLPRAGKATISLLQTMRKEGIVQTVRKGWHYLWRRHSPLIVTQDSYEQYVSKTKIDPVQRKVMRQKCDTFVRQPLISLLVPVYNTPPTLLRRCVRSVQQQLYTKWQLCLYDDASTYTATTALLKKIAAEDPRIILKFGKKNLHIAEASNQALQLATGDFIGLLDHDDELSEDALYWVVKMLQQHPDAKLLYSDEDKIDLRGRRFDPYFKSDWNYDLFLGQNMISHFGVYDRTLVQDIGGFRRGFEGSQDYDLALRCIEKISPRQIIHIPRVLYHWRTTPGSTAAAVSNKDYAYTAGKRALQEHLERQHFSAQVEENKHHSYRVRWELSTYPLVSIIIPTRDKAAVLRRCVQSILATTDYDPYEIIILDNQSEQISTKKFFQQCAREKNIRVLPYNKAFNFSALMNFGVQHAQGEVVVLLNNDTEVISPEWLTEMVSQAMRPGVGAVGAKLYYPNGQIQHGGVVLTEGHPGIHVFAGRAGDDPGYFNKLNVVQQYSAVSAACLAVQKSRYEEVGGFDAKHLAVAYNDVDFCLKLQAAGYRNLWTPFAELYHHESLSRGNDFDTTQVERFKKEHAHMLQKWRPIIVRDPFFNPNLAPDTRVITYIPPTSQAVRANRHDLHHAYDIALVLIAKDEDAYLEEFICYYLLLGVQHFYIYDNGSKTPIRRLLAAYQDCCDIINFPGKTKQFAAYNHYLQNFGHASKWTLVVDTDEFLVLKQHATLQEFIESYHYADAIGINWVYFGDNYHDKQPKGLVMENYPRCQEGQNDHIKTLVRTAVWQSAQNPHYLELQPGSLYIDPKGRPITGPLHAYPTTDIAQINHYFSKSKQECLRKYQRGRVDVQESVQITPKLYATWRATLNVREDRTLPQSYAAKVKKMLQQRRRYKVPKKSL